MSVAHTGKKYRRMYAEKTGNCKYKYCTQQNTSVMQSNHSNRKLVDHIWKI